MNTLFEYCAKKTYKMVLVIFKERTKGDMEIRHLPNDLVFNSKNFGLFIAG